MGFQIMRCPVCGAPLEVGNNEKYIICNACDTPLRLNEERTLFRADDAEAFGYHFEKGRQKARIEEERQRDGLSGSYYSSDRRHAQRYPDRQYPNRQYGGMPQYDPYVQPSAYSNVSDKDRWTALVICLILGIFGGHHFYVGNIKKGILYVFTCGLFCIGWFIDIICLAMGTFRDSDGRLLVGSKERENMYYGATDRVRNYRNPADPVDYGPGDPYAAYDQNYTPPRARRNRPSPGGAGYMTEEEIDLKNAKRKRIFLILMLIGILALLGGLVEGDLDGFGGVIIWVIVFGVLWFRTPKPRS